MQIVKFFLENFIFTHKHLILLLNNFLVFDFNFLRKDSNLNPTNSIFYKNSIINKNVDFD